jgi:hypothetical protein
MKIPHSVTKYTECIKDFILEIHAGLKYTRKLVSFAPSKRHGVTFAGFDWTRKCSATLPAAVWYRISPQSEVAQKSLYYAATQSTALTGLLSEVSRYIYSCIDISVSVLSSDLTKTLRIGFLRSCDRASWHVTVHRDMWPCIVTRDHASWHVTVHRDKFPCNKTK